MEFSASPPTDSRHVVLIGGTGQFGTLVAEALPFTVTLSTVSRTTTLPPYAQSTAFHFDILVTPPNEILSHIHDVAGRIDVLVYAPFIPHFTPLSTITRQDLIDEYTLLALYPILYAQSFRDYALAHPTPVERAYMPIGSGTHRGTPENRPDLGSYASCKAYLHESMRALAPTLERAHIRTVQLHPGSLRDEQVRSNTKAMFWREVFGSQSPSLPYVVHEIY